MKLTKEKPVKKRSVTKKTTRVPKTRNAGSMTESEYWGMIRSSLRNKSRFWKPRTECLKDARRPSQSTNKRIKWEFQCNRCKQWFPQKSVEVHHQEEAGSLTCANDLPLFVERLFTETGWECICIECHKDHHHGK